MQAAVPTRRHRDFDGLEAGRFAAACIHKGAVVSWNIAEFAESQLLERFGFATSAHKTAQGIESVFERQVDAQHAVIVSIVGFDRGAGVGHIPFLDLGLARRDINDLQAEMISADISGPWTKIVDEKRGRFLGREREDWISHMHGPEVVVDYLERWIPGLDVLANLSFIESRLNATADVRISNDAAWLSNRMLWGWRPEDDEVLEARLAEFARAPDGHPIRVQIEAEYERRRAWIAAHPDGVARELTGD